MSKLILLGLGLTGWNSLSLEGVDIVKSADKVYLEVYTSPVSDNLKKEIEKKIKFYSVSKIRCAFMKS